MDSFEEETVEASYDLIVSRVVAETADAHSVSFAVPEGAEHTFAYKPGQFLTLGVPPATRPEWPRAATPCPPRRTMAGR